MKRGPQYRIRAINADFFYAEIKVGWFWWKLPESSTWVDDSYVCTTRERALELIEAHKDQRDRDARTIHIEMIR